jgi:uncharacterized RDD family membrane protein YckC
MTNHAYSVGKRLFALSLLVIVGLCCFSRVNAVASVAILVFDHGLTKQPSWTLRGNLIADRTSNFTQDDPHAVAFVAAAVSSANVTWLWFDPEGELYRNDTQQIQCAVSPCYFESWLALARNKAATLYGKWTVNFQAGGVQLYSDSFFVTKVVLQDNYWRFNVIQSAPARIEGNLTVTIHPNNQTWSSYMLYMPFAANITAHEDVTNQPLNIVAVNVTTGRVVVDLGAPRSDGYRFVLSFDVQYGLNSPGGWDAGNFVFTWQESSWGTFNDGYHPIPGSFDVALPEGAMFVDTVGIGVISLNQNVTAGSRPTVAFNTTLSAPAVRFGWTIIYRDLTYRNSRLAYPTSTPASVGLNVVSSQRIPILPLTMGSLSLWAAVMSVFLLTASELLSPIYARTGILINRRRLRIAAMLLVTLFLASVAYQILLSQSIAAQVVR